MKNFSKIILFSLASLFMFSFSYAQEGRRANWGSTPFQVFEKVVGESNAGYDKIQKTALDGITDLEGSYSREYKISNTIDYLRMNIGPYIQWAVYVGFVASTAGLIICGFLMVTGGIGNSEGFKKIKGRLVNALLGVFILSGFYIMIKFMMSVINYFIK